MASFRLTLLDTAAPDRPGSMRRYAELVRLALAGLPDGERPAVTVVSLEAPAGEAGVPGGCDGSAGASPSRWALSRLANWRHHVLCALRVRGAVGRSRPDLVHILDGSHAYLAVLLPRRLPVVVTVHDLVPVLTERGELPGPKPSLAARLLWRLSFRGLRRCCRVVADSQSTADDMRRVVGLGEDLLAVVLLPVRRPESGVQSPEPGCVPTEHTNHPNGGRSLDPGPQASNNGPANARPPGHAFTPSHGLAPIVLHLGHNAAYKNRDGVLRIGALVAREMPVRLVLAGPAPTATLRCLAEDLGVAAGVDWRCEVSDADLQDLYRQAAVFLFPSRYEGFGWPPLEAMACGCPVVCANTASMPEVVGEAALTAPPDDHAQLARHCLDLLRQPDLRADLVRRGFANLERFTLRRFGDQLAAVYAAALGPG